MTNGFRLVMTKGPQPGQNFSLDKDMMIMGRDPSSDVVVNHPQASRQHARLRRQGYVIVLEDLGSTNGTFVNGTRITAPHTLSNGDVVGLGDSVTFNYYSAGPGAEETLVSRPSPAQQPDTMFIPQPSAAAPPPAPYTPTAYPAPQAYEQPQYAEPPAPKSRRGLLIGCGCLILLVIFACIALFLLDMFQILPPIFYEPLRWIGLDQLLGW
ncbi:MAG: FHA domain-containing protein [Anaerolineae bacterium]|nr:FHA domain-containing protein [Anaerolineae bacterium]